jgi:hypothetical protein
MFWIPTTPFRWGSCDAILKIERDLGLSHHQHIMSNPYSISLLNDLHHHFPDLLYHPTRFRNVGDVLNYVIGVAQHNPYEEQRAAYERLHPLGPSGPSPPSNVSAAPSSRSSSELLNVLYSSPLQSEILMNSSYGNRRRSVFQQPVDPIMSFIGSLIGDSSAGTSSVGIRAPSSVGIGSTGPFSVDMQAFLNDRVHVFPSPEQIEIGTILTTALQTQDDNCSICQDPIEQNQPMRIIRHCTHRFHQECIDTWFQQHISCPTCRHDIRE